MQHTSFDRNNLAEINRELTSNDNVSYIDAINQELIEYQNISNDDARRYLTENFSEILNKNQEITHAKIDGIIDPYSADDTFLRVYRQTLEKTLGIRFVEKFIHQLRSHREQGIELNLETPQDYFKYIGRLKLEIKADKTRYRYRKICSFLEGDYRIPLEDTKALNDNDINIIFRSSSFQHIVKNDNIHVKKQIFSETLIAYIALKQACPNLPKDQIKAKYRTIYTATHNRINLERTRLILTDEFHVQKDLVRQLSNQELKIIRNSALFDIIRRNISHGLNEFKDMLSDGLEMFLVKTNFDTTQQRKDYFHNMLIDIIQEYDDAENMPSIFTKQRRIQYFQKQQLDNESKGNSGFQFRRNISRRLKKWMKSISRLQNTKRTV